MEEDKLKKIENKNGRLGQVITGLLILGLVFAVFNQFQLLTMRSGGTMIPTGVAAVQAAVIPTGVPIIYGGELGISYDDISPNDQSSADRTIRILGNLDRTITLEGENLDRYIDITSQISCEYCCGAQSIIVRREDVESMNEKIDAAIEAGQITEEQAEEYRQNAGDAACGCAHSFAMRGVAKYLIIEHGSEFTDEEILDELGKLKTLFFPSQMAAKAAVMEEQGIEFSYANLGSNSYRGIERSASGSGGGMVGGC